jgi:hypothetical protein
MRSEPASLANIPADIDDDGMRRVYTLVLICHATVIMLLWLFGRTFSN